VAHLLDVISQLPIPRASYEALVIRYRLLEGSLDDDLLQEIEALLPHEGSGELLEAVAIGFLKAGDPQKAMAWVSFRDELNLQGRWLDLIVGFGHLMLNQHTLAKKAFEAVERDGVFRPLARFLTAKSCIHEGNWQKAISLLNEALMEWPEEEAWQHHLGTLYLDQNDLDSALPHLQRAVEIDPAQKDYQLSLARAYRGTGHSTQALRYYSELMESRPSDGKLWAEAGTAALEAEDHERAEAYFARAHSLSPTDPMAIIGSARSALALGKSKVALEHAKSALKAAPNHAEALAVIGDIYADQAKFEKALESYECALAHAKDPIPIRRARSKLFMRSGQPKEAIHELRSMLDDDPAREDLWADQAVAFEEMGDIGQALDAASKAIRLSPHHPAYRLLFGRLCRKAGQLDRALDEISKLEQADPTNANVLIELGQLYEERRQLDLAFEAYNRAISADGQNARACYHAGVLLKKLKAYSEAGEMLGRAVELDPRDADAMHQLAAVRALELVHGGIQQTAVAT
jgi:tetratricopeptide (TPR) repeat protein